MVKITESKLELWSTAYCLAICLAILLTFITPGIEKNALLRGDFPGFYVLGKILADGQTERLYDIATQKEVQNSAWPEMQGEVLVSVYPPPVALLLQPIGYLKPSTALLVWDVCSLLALGICIYCLTTKKISPIVVTAMLVSQPMLLVGTLGGQNTAFSLCILLVGLSLIQSGQRSKQFIAGLILSLWLLKPQFGSLAAICIIMTYPKLPLYGFIVGAALLFVTGSVVMGITWPLEYLTKITEFSNINYGINLHNQSSLLAPFNSTFDSLTLLWLPFVLLAVVLVAVKRYGLPPYSRLLFGLCLVPALSPQTLFYDLGIITGLTTAAMLQSKSLTANTSKSLILINCLAWPIAIYRNFLGLPFLQILSLFYLFLLFYILKCDKTYQEGKDALLYRSKFKDKLL